MAQTHFFICNELIPPLFQFNIWQSKSVLIINMFIVKQWLCKLWTKLIHHLQILFTLFGITNFVVQDHIFHRNIVLLNHVSAMLRDQIYVSVVEMKNSTEERS